MQNLDHALSAELNQRKLDHLYRKRTSHDGPQTPQLKINGKTLLAFCSNDYLGLANHPALISAAQNACVDYGLGSGASHLVAGHTGVHHELEEALAKLTQRPRALLFSSGYMANMGVLSSLLDRQDAVYQDRLNHASLLDGGLLSAAKFQRYRHQDLSDLQRQLDKTQARRHLVASDAVFSMDGDTALLKPLSQLCHAQQAWLMIDDAHGFGVLGPDGGGSALAQGLTTDDCPIYMQHLNYMIKLFKQQAEHLRLPLMPSDTAIQPLLIGSSEVALSLSESLKEMGFLVTAIRPPTVPKNTARLRITLSAAHTENHLQQLLAALLKLQHQGLLAVVDD